jgi:hypothetical protein
MTRNKSTKFTKKNIVNWKTDKKQLASRLRRYHLTRY